MSKKSMRVPDYLSHMLDAIHRIQRYTHGKSRDTFILDEQLQDAVVRNIEIIGEAARNVETQSPSFVAENDAVPWTALYAMRNRVSHGYWTVDLDAVWRVVGRDLPLLEAQIQELLRDSRDGTDGGSE